VSWGERKLIADLQARIGPTRSGAAGFFQGSLDLVKLLLKRDPREGRSPSEVLWILLQSGVLFGSIAALPWARNLLFFDSELSVAIPVFTGIAVAFTAVFLGLVQRTLAGWLAGVRVAAQSISAALPATICVIAAGARSGGLSWAHVVEQQGAWPYEWFALRTPFGFLLFWVFLLSGMMILGAAPFSAGYSHVNLQGGITFRQSGRARAFLGFMQFFGLFQWAMIAVALFVGGWNLPTEIGAVDLLQGTLMVAKTGVLMLLVTLAGRAMPMLRADIVTELVWRVLTPVALICLVGTVLFDA